MAKNNLEVPINVHLVDDLNVTMKSTPSVEIKRNSKGITEFVVKVYNADYKEALKEAQTAFNHLNKKYPYEG